MREGLKHFRRLRKRFTNLWKLFTILYADDTLLLAESAEEMQSELNYFDEYCEKWNLNVNTNKSSHVFFKGEFTNKFKF
jgi:hypothetical protein